MGKNTQDFLVTSSIHLNQSSVLSYIMYSLFRSSRCQCQDTSNKIIWHRHLELWNRLYKIRHDFWSRGVVLEFSKMADSSNWSLDYFVGYKLSKVRKYQYFGRFELEIFFIYEILPALDLTQSVHAKISIGMHREVKFTPNFKFPESPWSW